jgi:hypothetical protein
MKIRFLIIPLLLTLSACGSEQTDAESTFDKTKWSTREGRSYPYRDQMLNDIVYNDTIRSLNKSQVLELLGEPDRSTEGHLYYTVSRKHLGAWTIHSKSMVIKLSPDNAIEWIKIHE